MNSNTHQRAKAIFIEVVELPREHQVNRLQELCGSDESLRREVSSLLDFHTARSLVAEKPTPKIRTRSTLSTTRWDKPWYQKSLQLLPAIAPLMITLLLVLPVLWQVARYNRRHEQSVIADKLSSQLFVRSASLENWHQQLQAAVLKTSKDAELKQLLAESLKSSSNTSDAAVSSASVNQWQSAIDHSLMVPTTFMLWDQKLKSLASTQSVRAGPEETLGWTPLRNNDIRKALDGDVIVKIPSPQSMGLPVPLSNQSVSVLFPIRGDDGNPLAVMLVQSRVFDDELADLIKQWNSDDSTMEAYLVDAQGHLLTKNRNPENLTRLRHRLNQSAEGLKEKSVASPEGLLVRDPGGNLLEGYDPTIRAANWPLTFAAEQLSKQVDGQRIDGYRNYVGVNVVGVWRWMPKQAVGLILETPERETFAYHFGLQRWLSLIFGLCLLGSLVSLITAWPRRRSNRLRTVGPYQIQELLGQGGMGAVYLAEHSLLCRPTAIKVLSKEKAELSVLVRFEREVQLASQLTHPNTIAIYDFGRNEDGVFYYAMEYIDGGHIGELIEFVGPLPAGRCIYLVRQLCFALREAHLAGVVHRDIKPQNVMICDRGGEPDFVKLVDYGLVKAFAPGVSDHHSQTSIVMGTPRFMAPERLQSPWLADPRVDIYSIGCLLYYMLTAELPPLVTPTGSDDHVQLGVDTLDLQATAVPFSDLLGSCMSYDPASRPSSVASLLSELDELSDRFPWSRDDSDAWWKKRGTNFKQFLSDKRKKANANRNHN